LSEQHIGRRIARAMITIFVFQIFWKFGGFIVKTLILRQFGEEGELHLFDAYMFAESTIIWTLYVVFDKFIFPTFIPLFSEERELRGEDDAWRFANSFVNCLILVLLGALAACMVWAPQVVDFIAHKWMVEHPETGRTAIRFCRWMLPALFFVVLGSFTHALLNAHKRFAHAQAGMGMHRFVHALIFIVAFKAFGAPAIWAALAFTLAAPAKVITHGFGLREKLRNYRPWIPHWRQIGRPALRWFVEYVVIVSALSAAIAVWMPPGGRPYGVTALWAAALFFTLRGLVSWLRLRGKADKTLLQKLYLLGYPVLMGVLIARLRDLVQDSYATHLEQSGFFGAIKYAKSVGELPMALIPLALSMAMFPFLCDMFTKQNVKELSSVVSNAIKMIVLFFLPLTIVVVILRLPVIELLASNKVEPELVGATALALALFSLSFIFYASEMVLMQSFFSLQNTWVPTLIGAVASFGQIGLLYVAFDVLEGPDSAAKAWLGGVGVTPFVAVALAYPLSRAFKNLVLGTALHARLKLFRLRDCACFAPQVVLVSAVTGIATWGAWRGVSGVGATLPGKLIRLGVPSVAAAAAFLGVLFALRKIGWPVAEFDIILSWLHETGWQKIKGKLRGGKK
jgi:peptidoglycan biosynthesis protein MviN/MurJ (putative lipid II flippase)